MEPKPVAVAVAVAVAVPVVAKRAATAKVYPPHEHFGNPLNVCRICGEKYTYAQKPFTRNGLSNSEK